MSTPLCPYFGACGGCATQHLNYAVQLENKKKTLAQAIDFEKIEVFSDAEYGYRNRMDMSFHPGGLGFHKKGSWRHVVDVEQCAISNETLNRLIKEVRDYFEMPIDAFDSHKKNGTFRYAVIRAPQNDSSISFVLNRDSTRLDEAVRCVEAFAKVTSAANVLVAYVPDNTDVSTGGDYFVVKGSDMLRAVYLRKILWFSAQGFFQNNDVMAEKMHAYCHELLKKRSTKEAHLLDLYCGVSGFGVVNAELFKRVTMVESVKECIDAAHRNLKENGITNAEAMMMDAMHLKRLNLPRPLYVINDPPRSGMHEKTIEQLKKLEPDVMIYISCNVQQLAKDLPKFKQYRVTSAALFDLFPQTNHMESVIEMVKT